MDSGEILQGRGGMIGFLKGVRDRIRGGGEYAITVPPMDGALRPNNDLEEASVLVTAQAPGHLSDVDGALWFASGRDVMRVGPDGTCEAMRQLPSEITALAVRPGPEIFAACADGSCDLPEGYSLDALPAAARRCVTAIGAGPDGEVYLAVGSLENGAGDWSKDLLERRQTGSVWRLERGAPASQFVGGLAWPAGMIAPGDDLLVTEASRGRLVRASRNGAITPVLSNLPGYPAGLCPDRAGGYHLCIMAPRNQLIEFILRERDFVEEMIATTDRDHWIAPSLKAPETFLEPLQGGALKQLGIMKPWAPSRSIGLVMHLSEDFVPTRSHHSRADGKNHGTTSCALWRGDLVVASQGNNRLLLLPQEGGRA